MTTAWARSSPLRRHGRSAARREQGVGVAAELVTRPAPRGDGGEHVREDRVDRRGPPERPALPRDGAVETFTLAPYAAALQVLVERRHLAAAARAKPRPDGAPRDPCRGPHRLDERRHGVPR